MVNVPPYELFAIFYIPCTFVKWIIEYLSDKDIVKDEVNIGIIQFFHHLISTICILLPIILILSKSLFIALLTVCISTIMQIGWLINNNYCFYTQCVNKTLNVRKNRKWRIDIQSLIKHYIRGNEWAYLDMHHLGNKEKIFECWYLNILLLLYLIKLIIVRK
jgi:hypothetical protein